MVLTTPIICILTRVRTIIPVVRYGIPAGCCLTYKFSRRIYLRLLRSPLSVYEPWSSVHDSRQGHLKLSLTSISQISAFMSSLNRRFLSLSRACRKLWRSCLVVRRATGPTNASMSMGGGEDIDRASRHAERSLAALCGWQTRFGAGESTGNQ